MNFLLRYKIFEKSSLIRLGVPYDVMKYIQKEFALPDNIEWQEIFFKKDLKPVLEKFNKEFFIAVSTNEILVFFSIDQKLYLNRYYFAGEDDFGGGVWEIDERKIVSPSEILNLITGEFDVFKSKSSQWSYTGRINRRLNREEVRFIETTNNFKKEFADNFNNIIKKMFRKKSNIIKDVIITNLIQTNKNIPSKEAKKILALNIEKSKESDFYRRKSEEIDPFSLQVSFIRDNSLTIFNEYLIKFEDDISTKLKEFLTIPDLCDKFGIERIMTAFMYYIYAGKIYI